MDRLYQTFFKPARGHHSDTINYDMPSENILIKPLQTLITGTFASLKRNKVLTFS